jgi:hypothetical protein
MFKSIVTVVFHNIFHSEMHKIYIFYFLKIIFNINKSKRF